MTTPSYITGSAGGDGGTGTSTSISHTVAGGDLCIQVGHTGSTITALTLNGVSLLGFLEAEDTATSGVLVHAYRVPAAWMLANFTLSSSYTLQVTFAGSTGHAIVKEEVADVVSLLDSGATSHGAGTTGTITFNLASVPAESYVFQGYRSSANLSTNPASGQTARFQTGGNVRTGIADQAFASADTDVDFDIVASGGTPAQGMVWMHLSGASTSTGEGVVSIDDEDDVVSATGVLEIEGSAAPVDENDTVDATGVLEIEGIVSETDEDDTVSASGELAIEGSVGQTDQDDSVAASGILAIDGTVAVVDESDTVAAAGEVGQDNAGSATIDDEDDSAAASGSLAIEGAVDESDEDDVLSASAYSAIRGEVSVVDDNDTVSAKGIVVFEPLKGITGRFDPLLRIHTGKWLHPDHKYLCSLEDTTRYSGRHYKTPKYTGIWSS